MQLSEDQMNQLAFIFNDYINNCDPSAASFLNNIYDEIDADCMKYGFKDSNNMLYCDVSDRFNHLSGVFNHNERAIT